MLQLLQSILPTLKTFVSIDLRFTPSQYQCLNRMLEVKPWIFNNEKYQHEHLVVKYILQNRKILLLNDNITVTIIKEQYRACLLKASLFNFHITVANSYFSVKVSEPL